jgi:hypothetical protein
LTQSEEALTPEMAIKRKEKGNGNRWKGEVLAREKKQSEHNYGPNTS